MTVDTNGETASGPARAGYRGICRSAGGQVGSETGYLVSNEDVSWWGAINFCAANDRTLLDLFTSNPLQCYIHYTGSYSFVYAVDSGHSQGECSKQDSEELSEEMKRLQQDFGSGYLIVDADYYNYTSQDKLFSMTCINLSDGTIGHIDANNTIGKALCDK